MAALSPNQLLITNVGSQCVEEYNVDTGEMSPFAAACNGIAGSSHTGHRLNDVSLNFPIGVLYDGGQKVYVSIHLSHTILAIDTTTDQSSILLTTTIRPRLLGYGLNSDIIHLTLDDGLGAIKDGTVEYIIGTKGQIRGKTIGDISTTLVAFPVAFLEVDNGIWVIADRLNHR